LRDLTPKDGGVVLEALTKETRIIVLGRGENKKKVEFLANRGS